MKTLLTEAIVVRLVDYGEADRVATFLTREGGKIAALARGARRSRRRFGAALEPFAVGEAALEQRRGELWSLAGFHAAGGASRLALDITRMAHAAYVCELGRELVPDEAVDPVVYDLVRGALARLDAGDTSAAALRRYELALLDAVGFAPALDRCVACDRAADDDPRQTLDARRGGLVCADCGGGHGRRLAAPVRGALLAAQGGDAASLVALAGPDQVEARDAIQAILREHLPRALRSLEFIHKMNNGLA